MLLVFKIEPISLIYKFINILLKFTNTQEINNYLFLLLLNIYCITIPEYSL